METTEPSHSVKQSGRASNVSSDPVRLVCSEVWGRNRPVHIPIELPGVRGVLFSRPCDGGRGGDVHYLSVCGSGLLSRMCLADVVGHGEQVAAVSDEMHRQLRRFMNQPDQRRVLRDLNERLVRMGLRAMTTAVAVSYYPPRRKLSISHAGHPPGWLYRVATGSWTRVGARRSDANRESAGRSDTSHTIARRNSARTIDARATLANLPLGVDESTEFSRHDLRVERGDRLLLVTDGVLEAPSTDGTLFGEVGIEACLHESAGLTCPEVGGGLLQALRTHGGEAALNFDDVTFLLIEFVAPPRGPALWHAIKNRLLRRGNHRVPPRQGFS